MDQRTFEHEMEKARMMAELDTAHPSAPKCTQNPQALTDTASESSNENVDTETRWRVIMIEA
jgi:hypothetical protein